jgi:hypothetical protein
MPGQLFGVDQGRGQAFGWKPRFLVPSNILVRPLGHPNRSPNNWHAQFWQGAYGRNPNRPLVSFPSKLRKAPRPQGSCLLDSFRLSFDLASDSVWEQ